MRSHVVDVWSLLLRKVAKDLESHAEPSYGVKDQGNHAELSFWVKYQGSHVELSFWVKYQGSPVQFSVLGNCQETQNMHSDRVIIPQWKKLNRCLDLDQLP